MLFRSDLDGELERFSEMAPESDASVVVIGGCDDARTYRRMRWMGVSEYIATPVDQEEISGILAELAREKLANGRVIDANRHVCVYGVRGGAGASSIAATLATAMAEDHRARTLLLDLDIRHGTQYLLFGFDPAEGLIDMFETPARIDPLIMNRAMERVSQNLSVLSSHSGEPDGAIHADSPRTLVTNGQRGFEYVITDVPARNDECRDMILTAGTLFLVTDATIPGLRDTLTTLGYLERHNYPHTPIIVINRLGQHKGDGLSEADFKKRTGQRVLSVPFDPRVAARMITANQSLPRQRGGMGRRINPLVAALPTAGKRK